jgi:hypothetical protein
MVWTPPRTWVAGEQPAASVFNQHVRDNLIDLDTMRTAWTAYTPVWSKSAPATPTFSVQQGRYKQNGKTVSVEAMLTASSTTASGTWELTLPVAARELVAGLTPIGFVYVYTSSGFVAMALSKSGDLTKVQFAQQGQTGGTGGRIVAAINSGNALWANLHYEAA